MTFARVRALIVVAALLVTAGAMVLMAINRDSQIRANNPDACPSGLVPADIEMPAKREDVTINVYNGTKTPGLAEKIGRELEYRKFKVNKVASAPGGKTTDNIATIVYGPLAVGAGWLTSANFLVDDDVEMRFEIDRQGAEVDIILGTQFLQLASPTEVNQAIAQNGKPLLPDGTCEI
jgi:hypothetical protein